jgi:hypothetical protein
MSNAFPPPPPSEPEPDGASTPTGSSTPEGYPPPSGTGGSAIPGDEGGYPPPSGTGGSAIPGDEGGYPPAGGAGDYSAPPPTGQPTYSSPAPPPQSAPASRPANASMTGDQMKVAFQNANRLDLGIIAAGVLAFIFSLFSYYTISYQALGISGLGNGSTSAWHGFLGWFAVLLALAGAVIVALPLLGVRLAIPTRLVALGAFAAATLFTLLALFVDPGNGGGANIGRGFGYWATFVMIIAGLVLCVMRKDAVD